MPNLVTFLNWTPIFDRCMVGFGSKNIYQEDMRKVEGAKTVQNQNL